MAFMDWFRRGQAQAPAAPRAETQSASGGVVINTSQKLEEALRVGNMSAAGIPVNPGNAMRVATVFACVRIRSGIPANMPCHLKRRIDDRTREDATDHPLWNVLTKRPNRWQTPSQFKRMMDAHKQLRGNAYAMIVRSRGQVIELIPLHPDRVKPKQADDLSIVYEYTRKDGRRVILPQREVFHLVGMTLDGVNGVSVLTYARETIGFSMVMEQYGSKTFKNGARPSVVMKHPGSLGKEGQENLRASLDEYRSGGESEGKALILEEGMDVSPISMTSEDAQWIESRKLSRTDLAMFWGVPPHMTGDTEKSTSWGTGIEQQTQGFLTFTAEDDLTGWEETINRDLIDFEREPDLYARFNRKALVRADLKTRWEAYVKALQWGVYSPNKVLELEDENPREGGDIWYPPPNTAGNSDPNKDQGNEPAQPA